MPYVALLIAVITLTLWVRSWFDPSPPPEPLPPPRTRLGAVETLASPFVAFWALSTLALYAIGFAVGILWPFALLLWVVV